MQDNKDRNPKLARDGDEDDDSKIFPQKLMEILSDERFSEAISWLPHGKAFVIRNRDLFAENVMPQFFSRKAKYSSFTRKLNRWNFVRVSSGPEMGAYYHEYFRRDKPQLAAQMFCKNARSKLAMATDSFTVSPPQQPKENRNKTLVSSCSGISNSDSGIHPSIVSALNNKDGAEGVFAIKTYAPVLGVSNMQLMERQIQLMQEEFMQRILLQQLAAKKQMEENQIQQQLLIQQQKQVQQQAELMRMRQLMELRARQRLGTGPNNGRASAA